MRTVRLGAVAIAAAIAAAATMTVGAPPASASYLYPQAVSNGTGNPNGCWDWWGYTGAGYAQRGAPQMATIMAMVHAIGG